MLVATGSLLPSVMTSSSANMPSLCGHSPHAQNLKPATAPSGVADLWKASTTNAANIPWIEISKCQLLHCTMYCTLCVQCCGSVCAWCVFNCSECPVDVMSVNTRRFTEAGS